jgi:Cd2+/Zn2+-exporting ATPase
MAFDKTGTLTTGHLKVVEVVPLSGHDQRELIERAAAMEQHSQHPIAQAVLQYAAMRGITPAAASGFRVVPGKGATATFAGRQFWLGSHRYLEERGQETEDIHNRLSSMAELGRTVVVVGNEEHVCGLIGLSDDVRRGAPEMLRQLKSAGIEHLIMLTGDNRPTAEAIAAKAGVDEVRAELLPEDKVSAVDALVEEYQQVAMVGDGVNDAPAMARATIGIAMGSAGTDAAIETADIALMSDDLTRLPWLIGHSRRTLSIVRQNITFALAVKAAFVLLTFGGLSSLWAAIAADMGASLLVIFNGLRLLRATGH